jgi:hypothetical protein
VQTARRLTAFLLVTLWLPALLHCRLEAAGLLFESDCCSAAPGAAIPAADHGCATDACEVIEGEFPIPAGFEFKAPAADAEADLFFCALIAPLADLVPPPDSASDAAGTAPPELARAWALIVPGAASPRAP